MEQRKVILAIDDMSLNLRTIQVILDKQFNVRLAKSGEIALSILGSSKVDLILLDIEMPGMSGFEFLDVLKKLDRAKDVPVIFVTSHASTELIARATKAGAKDYVMKPFEPAVLQKKVYAVLNMQDIYITKDGKAISLPPR
jgi:putative two-component system response regulator